MKSITELKSLIDEYGKVAIKTGQANSGVAIDCASGMYSREAKELRRVIEDKLNTFMIDVINDRRRCRIEAADRVLDFYLASTDCEAVADALNIQIEDLISSLLHLASSDGYGVEQILKRSRDKYEIELTGFSNFED